MESGESAATEPVGIFISRGVSLRIRDLKIIFGPDGPEIPPITTEVLLGMAPFWLEIAMRHLEAAEAGHAAALDARKLADDNAFGHAVEEEFTAGMQSIVASATAMDALYASVRDHTNIPAEMTERWRRNRTARFRQVTEVLRRAFRMRGRGVANLRIVLREMYRFRDMAVHPSGRFSVPVVHPDYKVGTERRFIAFGAGNARNLFRGALALTALLVTRPLPDADDAFLKLCEGMKSLIGPLVARWKELYGPLTDEDVDVAIP